MMKKLIAIMVFATLAGGAVFAATRHSELEKGKVRSGQNPHSYAGEYKAKLACDYLLYLPEDYGRDKTKRWPVVLFLHGSGERGTNVNKVKGYGLPKVLRTKTDFPAIVISPLCPASKWWDDVDVTLAVMQMLDDVCGKLSVDKDRIYLTGLSMGGFGTWHLAQQYPNRFAALAPICGGGNAWLQSRLRRIPARVYHGAKDRNVPVGLGKMMAGALKQAGGKVELVIYPNKAHNVWDAAYSDPKLWEWMFAQTRKKVFKPKLKPSKIMASN